MSFTNLAVLIRDSLEADVAAIQAIYAHHVLHGTCLLYTSDAADE